MRPELATLALLLAAGTAHAQHEAGAFTIGGERFVPVEILDARALPDIGGGAAILVTMDERASKRLAALTGANVGKPLPFALDGKALMEPVVREPIAGGAIEISGHFTLAEAESLAKRISGKDPLPDSLDE